MKNNKEKVLVVGGAGYIGSMLVPMLLESGHYVRSTDLLLYENGSVMLPYLTSSRFNCVRADLRDSSAYPSLLEGVSHVVILAALVGDPISKKYPNESEEINVQAMRAFLEHCKQHELSRIVFVSTCSNYGLQPDNAPADESAQLNPLSIYAKNKVAIEEYLLCHCPELPYVILRFSTAFGLSPRMRFDLTVSEFTRELYEGRELLVYDPDTWRPYCHVRDLVSAIKKTLTADSEQVNHEVFNVGGNENNYTKRAIVEAIQIRLQSSRISYKEHGSDPRNYRVDFKKIREILGFVPQLSVGDGIDELLMALQRGVFEDVDCRPNFYGNRAIPLFGAKG